MRSGDGFGPGWHRSTRNPDAPNSRVTFGEQAVGRGPHAATIDHASAMAAVEGYRRRAGPGSAVEAPRPDANSSVASTPSSRRRTGR